MMEVSARNFEACHLSDLGRRLPDALGVHGPVGREQQLAERFRLLVVAEVGLVLFEQRQDAVAQRVLGHQGLFAGANGAVIEGFPGDDLGDSVFQIGRGVHQDGHVARPYSERRFAARIGGFHHGVSAGGQDHAHAFMPHEGVNALHGGAVHALNDVFGRAGFECRLI